MEKMNKLGCQLDLHQRCNGMILLFTICSCPIPQVKVLELESQLENERLRLGELRKKHYNLAGVPLEELSEGNGDASSLANPATMSPKPSKPALMKKPALAQKPHIPPKVRRKQMCV